MAKTVIPYIPEYITVHLGAPDQSAQNVTVSFVNYIKNVASSEIYPTWDEAALRSNILAQISYALNRCYLEYYRSRGYNFDITNNTAIDQKFINGRNIFDNIDRLVSDIFNDYIRRRGFLEPLAAKYCNGTTSTCSGLSQWGSQYLASDGYNSVEILKNYYGNDIEIVNDAPIKSQQPSYPGYPLRRGASGEDIFVIQVSLNRISQNYPLIPKISNVDGIFGEVTEQAVKVFQSIFNLTPDGIVGKATWYKLVMLYVGIKNLSELNSEGQKLFGVSLEYPDAISEGDRGQKVVNLQYFINVIADFYLTIPAVSEDGVFGPETKNAVIQCQMQFGLAQTGVVDDATWNEIYEAFKGIANEEFVKEEVFAITTVPYGGTVLTIGTRGDDVTTLQQYLSEISNVYTNIPPVNPTGLYGRQTANAVMLYQRQFGLPATGNTDGETWNSISNTYKDVVSAGTSRPRQYPGRALTLGDSDTM